MSGILSLFSSKPLEQQLAELKVDCNTKIQTLQKQVDEEAKAKAVAVAVAPVAQPAAAAGGGRRRKTSRKSPSKKRATKSMYSKIKKWFK